MSHTTRIKSVEIKSPAAVRSAVEFLKSQGLTIQLLENATPRMYFANQFKNNTGLDVAEYVIQVNNEKNKARPCDIAIFRNKEGAYEIAYDSWGHYISDILGIKSAKTTEGETMGKFLQEYVKQATIEQAMLQGYAVSNVWYDEEENLKIEVSV